jgi:hypothetical protein
VLRIRELAELARSLDSEAFVAQMGPFALMQRPTPDSLKKVPPWLRRTMGLHQGAVRGPPAPVDFEELLVATLPPADPNGTITLTIGRSPECDLVLEDPTISARHAGIAWDGNGAVLLELGSSNGTYLNGLKLGRKATLRTGDTLAFGRASFIYLLANHLHARLLRVRHD